MHDELRHKLLGRWAAIMCDHPVATLVGALTLAAACVVITLIWLGFQPDRNDLIDPELDWNARYIDYIDRFSADDIIVVVQVPEGEGGVERAEGYVKALAERLRADTEHVEAVYAGLEPGDVPPAFIRALPVDELEDVLDSLTASGPLLTAGSVSQMYDNITGEFAAAGQWDEQAAASEMERLAELTAAVRDAVGGEPAAEALAPLRGGKHFIAYPDEPGVRPRVLLMQVAYRAAEGELDAVTPVVEAMRGHLTAMEAAYPQVEAGLTGVPVVEADETVIATTDATKASILAVVLIAVLLVVAFHGWHMPVLAIGALLTGIAWSFGFLTLSIGYLQLLSVVFTVILLGLGIDFGIHLIARFELVRPVHPSGEKGFRAAMMDVFQTMGPGIITGAVTTAVAFGTTLLTDFTGMAEMGLIAAVGILLCLLAMFTVLPALIRLIRPRRGHHRPVHKRPFSIYSTKWSRPFTRHPWATCGVAVVLVAGAVWTLPRVPYDYNFSSMLPQGAASVQWQNKLFEYTDESIFFGVSVVDADAREEAESRVRRLRELPTVASLGGAAMLFPAEPAKRNQLIESAAEQIGPTLGRAAEVRLSDGSPSALIRASLGLRRLFQLASGQPEVRENADLAAAIDRVIADLTGTVDTLEALPAEQATARVTALNQAFHDYRAFVMERAVKGITTRPLTIEDLPPPVRHAAVSDEGEQLAIFIYPSVDVNDMEELSAFANDVQSVDSQVTGTVMQVYESASLIRRSYQYAGLYAFIAVFVLVFLDFRSVTEAVLAMLPVGMAFVGVFAMLWGGGQLTGEAWAVIFSINPANIIVLPLLFGIGVDHGVHVVHRYKQAPLDRPLGLTAGTGKGITLTSFTTMIGFGAMTIADHRGIVSLGLLLAVGVGLTWLGCVMVMPAALELLTRWRVKRGKLAGQSESV